MPDEHPADRPDRRVGRDPNPVSLKQIDHARIVAAWEYAVLWMRIMVRRVSGR